MFKRIVLITVATGLGQIIGLFALKLSSLFLSAEKIASIAQVDALIFLSASILAAGLQSSAMRNLAMNADWRSEFIRIQSARFSLSLLLFVIGISLILKWEYAVFFFAPLIALNGDYALYALGQPVKAAFIACLRLLIPYASLITGIYFAKDVVSEIFAFAWLGSYLGTNKLIAKFLNVKMVVKPVFGDLKLYLQSLPLGIGIVSSNFLGIGLVLIIPYFYPSVIEATAFLGLKFYTIFKGILRIIHQAFFKEMFEEKMCLKVDQISILIALAYVTSFIFFPSSVINNFLGGQYVDEKVFFILLGVSAVIYSFLPSTSIKALFDRKDAAYSIVVSIAALAAIVGVIVLGILRTNVLNIAISIVIGELAMAAGLFLISSGKNLLLPRLVFLLKNLPVFVIPLVFRSLFGDVFIWYVISFSIVSVILILINYKNFKIISLPLT